ncbi:hypothetical protein AB0Q95_29755 [Streptomyces sp. NPDC059900]
MFSAVLQEGRWPPAQRQEEIDRAFAERCAADPEMARDIAAFRRG